MHNDGLTLGQRVEIDQVGEGTIVGLTDENELEVAVSELETYIVSEDQVRLV
ncbi:hypothetical protein [Paenibacillus alkalitolerans]|uniref:hypothetical protein n=1 Tax=Paenibacillus alkalitolerans TaxID=2799335 RepID=UPI0018F5E738|nr:hypothetical protein [Paenibacillus alkalitolerans]